MLKLQINVLSPYKLLNEMKMKFIDCFLIKPSNLLIVYMYVYFFIIDTKPYNDKGVSYNLCIEVVIRSCNL